MSSVHHAEIIAHKIGEGLGTLVLALCVTVIEVGLIISLMSQAGGESSFLALGLDPKNTVFMMMTFLVAALTLGTGKSTLLQGEVHAVILFTYFVMSVIP